MKLRLLFVSLLAAIATFITGCGTPQPPVYTARVRMTTTTTFGPLDNAPPPEIRRHTHSFQSSGWMGNYNRYDSTGRTVYVNRGYNWDGPYETISDNTWDTHSESYSPPTRQGGGGRWGW